jgi:hypothetical protein
MRSEHPAAIIQGHPDPAGYHLLHAPGAGVKTAQRFMKTRNAVLDL